MGTIKRFHLDVDAADLLQRVGVGTGARRNTERAPQLFGSSVELGLGAAVENLDDVDAGGDSLDSLLAEMASGVVIRMFEINKTALLLDSGDGFLWRQAPWNCRAQKQANELALARQDFLANDHRLTGVAQGLRAGDSVVVSQNDRGEAELPAPTSDFQ